MTQQKLHSGGLTSRADAEALLRKRQKNFANASQEELVGIVNDLKEKLKKRNQDLTRTRERLSKARARIQKLKSIVSYQRERIIQLHA